VDGELDDADRERAFALLSRDEAVKRRVCDLRGVGELIRHAYDRVPVLPKRPRKAAYTRLARCAAVCGMLAVGAALAWMLIDREWAASRPVAQATASDVRILMHLSSSEPEKITEVLTEAESVINHYREIGQPARVEVIANGDGINLLLASSSQYAERVRTLREQYPNLGFSACRNTLELFAKNGVDVRLQHGIGVVESGVAEIIQRREAGWAYLRV